MQRFGFRPGARDRVLGATLIVSGTRVPAVGSAIIGVSMVLVFTGCSASPDAEAQATPTPTSTATPSTPTPTPSTSAEVAEPELLGFAEGAQLDPLAKVGWRVSLGGEEWTTNPAAQPGEVSFVNADGTCTAYYYQDVFETSAVDDRAASDEYLSLVSGQTADAIAPYAGDEYFALVHASAPEVTDGRVANRSVFTQGNGEMQLNSARVFTNMDYATSQMNNAYALQVRCDASIDPLTQLASLDKIAQIAVD